MKIYNFIMKGNIFPRKRKGTKYSRIYMIDWYTSLGMLNTRKGTCGEFAFRAKWECGFVLFSTLPGRVAAEIMLEAYIVSWESESHKLQLENGSMTLETGKSQSPHCEHLPCRCLSAGPLQSSTCLCLLMLWVHVHPSNSRPKSEHVTFSLP